jgi:hypothetical protein
MLDEQELKQVRDYVITILPELLRSDPTIVATIDGIIARELPRRDELARMLDVLEQTREEQKRGFEQQEKRADEHDKRFDRQDERFDRQDERFDRQDERFDRQDERSDRIEQRIEELRAEQNRRFDEHDRRFERQDERFDEHDRRFDRIEAKLAEHDRRFDQIDKTLLGMKRDIAKLQAGQDSLRQRFDRQEAWMMIVSGELGNTTGIHLEQVFATALAFGLNNPDIVPENIRLRQKLVDTEGRFFDPGETTEVDILVQNGQLIVFEVKSKADVDDVRIFSWKYRLIREQNPGTTVRGVMVVLAITDEVRERCARYGLELVH